MILEMFSVLDAKTQAYMQPFYAPTVGAAIRNFTDALQDPDSMLCKHPEDFHLFHIGNFDDHSCVLTSQEPVALGNALQYKEATQ